MRSALAWLAITVLAGAGVFSWQRSEIVGLRGQVARQGEALADNQERLDNLSGILAGAGRSRVESAGMSDIRRPLSPAAVARESERRVILDQYADVLARLNLPNATASRLQDLLVDRVEAVLDAQDAAAREGFAEGSSETARAVALAVGEVDREIVALVGPPGTLRPGAPPDFGPPEPPPVPAAAAPAVVVNVVTPAAGYSDSGDQVAQSDAYAPYFYYPISVFPAGTLRARPFAGTRLEASRQHRGSQERAGRR